MDLANYFLLFENVFTELELAFLHSNIGLGLESQSSDSNDSDVIFYWMQIRTPQNTGM